MKFQVLQYFLAVAREESITSAAESLHLSQPTLSRQLKELEEELGVTLFERGSRKITLTEEGMFLRRRAEEISDLVRKTEHDLTSASNNIAGDIQIGAVETDALRPLLYSGLHLQQKYPQIRYHIFSEGEHAILEQLDKGLIDFGVIFNKADPTRYHALLLPNQDIWGILMRKDSPLSQKPYITPEDLWDQPLIITQRMIEDSPFLHWIKREADQLHIVATYNLIYTAALMVEAGFGYAFVIDKIIHTSEDSPLCFRPLFPSATGQLNIIWKRHLIPSKPVRLFLEQLQRDFPDEAE